MRYRTNNLYRNSFTYKGLSSSLTQVSDPSTTWTEQTDPSTTWTEQTDPSTTWEETV